MGYYLMVKIAKELDIKYLCKCGDYKDPLTYKGSGVYWRRILRKYSPTIHTEILGYYETKEALREAGEYYSLKFNIVEDNTWANLIPEIGDGGPTVESRKYIHNPDTKECRAILESLDLPAGWVYGRPKKGPRDPAITEKIVAAQTGQIRNKETRERMRQATRKKRKRVNCDVCGVSITPQNLKRHMETKHG